MRPPLSSRIHRYNILFYGCLALILLIQGRSQDSTIDDDDSPFLVNQMVPSNSTIPSVSIDPGTTKKLAITLIGNSEKIVITFQADFSQMEEVYKLQIRTNDRLDSSQVANFPTQENLSFNLDTKRNLFVIQGDKKIRISKLVKEKKYILQVQKDDIQIQPQETSPNSPVQTQLNIPSADTNTPYYIVAGILGGVVAISGISKLLHSFIKWRRRERRMHRTMPLEAPPGREADGDGTSGLPVIKYGDPHQEFPAIGKKVSLNLDEKGLSCGELDAIQSVLFVKNPSNGSMGSIESLGAIRAVSASTASTISAPHSSNSIPNVKSEKKVPQLEAISEEPSYVKLSADRLKCSSTVLGLKKIVNSSPEGRNVTSLPEIAKVGNKFRKLTQEPKGKGLNGRIILENKIKAPKPVTVEDIRKLVQKVMDEKAKEENNISEEEEDSDEDQGYELTNYFSCMLCQKESRCIVTEPCGHIFACHNCATKGVKAGMYCILCHQKIRGFYNLREI